MVINWLINPLKASLRFVQPILKEGKRVAKVNLRLINCLMCGLLQYFCMWLVNLNQLELWLGILIKNGIMSLNLEFSFKRMAISLVNLLILMIDMKYRILDIMINSRPIAIIAWTPNFWFSRWNPYCCTTIYLWTIRGQSHWIKLEAWLVLMGVPTQQRWISFARMLIDVDVTKKPPEFVSIEDTQRRIIEEKVHF